MRKPTTGGNKSENTSEGLLGQKEDEGLEEESSDHSEDPGAHSVKTEVPDEARCEWLMVDRIFMTGQTEGPTLSWAWEQVTNTEDEGTPTNEYLRCPASRSTRTTYTG